MKELLEVLQELDRGPYWGQGGFAEAVKSKTLKPIARWAENEYPEAGSSVVLSDLLNSGDAKLAPLRVTAQEILSQKNWKGVALRKIAGPAIDLDKKARKASKRFKGPGTFSKARKDSTVWVCSKSEGVFRIDVEGSVVETAPPIRNGLQVTEPEDGHLVVRSDDRVQYWKCGDSKWRPSSLTEPGDLRGSGLGPVCTTSRGMSAYYSAVVHVPGEGDCRRGRISWWTNERKWQIVHEDSWEVRVMAQAGDALYVRGSDGRVRAYNLDTGVRTLEIEWNAWIAGVDEVLGSPLFMTPIPAQTPRTEVASIVEGKPKPLFELETVWPFSATVIKPLGNNLFCAFDTDQLWLLDRRTGRVVARHYWPRMSGGANPGADGPHDVAILGPDHLAIITGNGEFASFEVIDTRAG
jgi:hypothetical protein